MLERTVEYLGSWVSEAGGVGRSSRADMGIMKEKTRWTTGAQAF